MHDRKKLIYVLDSSALIAMQNELWPMQHFPIVWTKLNGLADGARLLACEAVKEECAGDELVRWFSQHPGVVVGPSSLMEFCMKRLMKDLQSKNKRLVDYESCSSKADPFVVACAMVCNLEDGGHFDSGRCVVVQHEGSAGSSPTRVKIPDVCDWYGIKYIRALDIVREEKWVF